MREDRNQSSKNKEYMFKKRKKKLFWVNKIRFCTFREKMETFRNINQFKKEKQSECSVMR